SRGRRSAFAGGREPGARAARLCADAPGGRGAGRGDRLVRRVGGQVADAASTPAEWVLMDVVMVERLVGSDDPHAHARLHARFAATRSFSEAITSACA